MKKRRVIFNHDPKTTHKLIVIENYKELEEYAKFREKKFLGALEEILHDENYDTVDIHDKNVSSEKRMIKFFHQENNLISATHTALTKVIKGMEKSIMSNLTIFVNDNGGYTVHKKDNYEILGDVDDSLEYPCIKKGSPEFLVIENATKISNDLKYILEQEGINDYTLITELPTLPKNIIINEISSLIAAGLKEIIFESQLLDVNQREEIGNLINSLPKLKIRILTSNPEVIPQTKHEVIVYNYMFIK